MVHENILSEFMDFSWHCNDSCKIYADTLKVVSFAIFPNLNKVEVEVEVKKVVSWGKESMYPE